MEDAVHQFFERRLRRTGWRINIVAYTCYGAPGWVRVMCRVLIGRPDTRQRSRLEKVRGWRSFTTLPAKHVTVTIEAGGVRHETQTDRSGFIDTVVEAELPPGWGSVRLSMPDAEAVEAPVRILDPAVRFGILSDIDDTVMVTTLPRPLLAAWNTFVLDEH
ncbi:ACP synthase, partial [Micromonospora musae]